MNAIFCLVCPPFFLPPDDALQELPPLPCTLPRYNTFFLWPPGDGTQPVFFFCSWFSFYSFLPLNVAN